MKKINQKFLYGTGSFAIISGVCIIIILLNLLAGMITERFELKLDFTETKILDFSEGFENIIKSVNKEIEIYFLVNSNEVDSIVQENNYVLRTFQILEKMEKINPNFKLTVEEPDKNPELKNRFGTVNLGDIIFSCDDNFTSMHVKDTINYDSEGNHALVAENKFASMINSVLREKNVKVGMVTGHDEEDSSAIKKVFDDEDIEYEDFNILIDGISNDYDMIFIYGPRVDFSVDEINKIEEYLASGHNMQIYLDKVNECTNLVEYMSQLGIGYVPYYIEETNPSNLISGYAVPNMNVHSITNTIGNKKLVVPYTVSVMPLWTSKNSIDAAPILYTSEKARLYSNQSEIGLFCIMTISSRITESKIISNVLAGGSSYIYNEGVMIYNKPLLINSVMWMGKADESVYLSEKLISNEPLNITKSQYTPWQFFLAFVIPFIIIIIGVFVWIKRRYL